jgi:hypothetical protein
MSSKSKFVRGYLFGFFDAALQRLGLPCKSDDDAILRIIAGHSLIFHDQKIDVIQYVKDSVNLQDDPEYTAAHQKELMSCLTFSDEEGLLDCLRISWSSIK